MCVELVKVPKLLNIPKDSYVLLRQILISIRLEAGATQADLASTLNVPQSFVSKYETGERRIDVVEFLLICRALGADPCAELQRLIDRTNESCT